ncbi:3-ketoacyl-CoA synthase 12-like [Rutidosis leptorrhynchoides]|uniref:3-ketoacyl-CoA synthase 12-like n=1 Tax=Rutidosis leptorrhynchoides TaxID=125765 RepID=UPI003A99C771
MDYVSTTIFLIPLFFLLCILFKILEKRRHQNCYILDYQLYKPSDDRKLTTGYSGDIIMRNKNLGLNEYKFLLKAIVSSGIGEETYGPKMVFDRREDCPNHEDAINEMEEFFSDIEKLFHRTGIRPDNIDVLVVNVSMLATMPSLSGRIVKKYKMREDVKSYNLSGMGCSASLISINLVQNIFKSKRNQLALVVTSECLTPNWYTGNERSMILSNCLFRSGGCAMILTNKPSLVHRSMFKLKAMVRTHHGSKDEAYGCCLQTEDSQGRLGFHLGKTLPKTATRAFVDNLKDIAPKILPIRELIRFATLSLARKTLQYFLGKSFYASRPMINFKTGIDHFCLHTGGKAVIDAVAMSLNLSQYDIEPARMTLHRFGNTSASSLWYVLGYMESKKRLKKGGKLFMISFGAGFKCNSCLWEVVRDLEGEGNIWKDCNIENYPPKTIENPFMEKWGWLNDEDIATFKYPDQEQLSSSTNK